jgi:hypothetical protein
MILKVKLKPNLQWLTRLFPIACGGLVEEDQLVSPTEALPDLTRAGQ